MLMPLLLKAQNNYPSKRIIGTDTVICSTVEQQKSYLKWKADRDECRETLAEKDKAIYMMDSLVREQKKLITLQDKQDDHFRKLIQKMEDINTISNEKYSVIQNSLKQEKRKNKRTSFAIGFSVGSLALISTTLLIVKLIK